MRLHEIQGYLLFRDAVHDLWLPVGAQPKKSFLNVEFPDFHLHGVNQSMNVVPRHVRNNDFTPSWVVVLLFLGRIL
jgi:hypothetical protein